jgi:hypothetical protein
LRKFSQIREKSAPISETPHWRAAQVFAARVFGFLAWRQLGIDKKISEVVKLLGDFLHLNAIGLLPFGKIKISFLIRTS